MTEPLDELRAVSGRVGPPPAAMAVYLAKVRERASTVTDADVEALKAAGLSDDEIFEQTVTVAVDEGLRRLDAGLKAVGG